MSVTHLKRAARQRPAVPAASSSRSLVAPVQETLAVVLDEDTPVLDSDQDVSDLVLLLRGHLMRLGACVPDSTDGSQSAAALEVARELADAEMPGQYMTARVHLRKIALSVQAVLTAMGAEGLVCPHRPECPSAEAPDCQAAQVRLRCDEGGYSVLCNGILLFDDTGCLRPDGRVVQPRRPLPSAESLKAVTT
uniref:DUF5999 family protein n=1 Tax=Streptomyces sp. F12 TaxID=1436084 RepID=UPI001C64D2C6|nr:DUF5999 family protein [Streptomyces sp. F12]